MSYDYIRSHKNQIFTLSLENKVFEKPYGSKIDLPPPTRPSFPWLKQGECSISSMNPICQTVFICIVEIVNCHYYEVVFIMK